jgi:hypothetical protein
VVFIAFVQILTVTIALVFWNGPVRARFGELVGPQELE